MARAKPPATPSENGLWSNMPRAEQGGREQRAGLLPPVLDLGLRARAHRAAAGDDDRAFGAGELLGQLRRPGRGLGGVGSGGGRTSADGLYSPMFGSGCFCRS